MATKAAAKTTMLGTTAATPEVFPDPVVPIAVDEDKFDVEVELVPLVDVEEVPVPLVEVDPEVPEVRGPTVALAEIVKLQLVDSSSSHESPTKTIPAS